MRTAVAAVVACTICAGVARAKPAEDPRVAEARQHYEAGLARFNLKEYKAAIEEFEAAYRLKPDPVFLFNLAQAHRLGDEPEQAIHFYKAYLRTSKTPTYRKEVEQWVADLQAVVEAKKAAAARPPETTLTPGETTPPPPPQPQPVAQPSPSESQPVDVRAGRHKRIAGIAVAGAGVAAIGVGIAFSVLAKQASDKLTNGTQDAMYDLGLDKQGRTDQNVAIAMYCVGGAAVATGAVLFALGWRQGHTARLALVPLLGPKEAGAHAIVRF